MAVAWPTIRAQLAAWLPTVVGSTVTVYDGPVVSGEAPPSYLTIAETPSTDDETGGTFTQEVGPDGFLVTETGTILSELAAVSGDATVPSVFASFDLIAAWVQADMTLGGVLSPGSTCTVSAVVVQVQTSAGAVQRLILTFNYFTRL
jgi:hypothetical protein